MHRYHLTPVALSAVAVLALAACGGGDDAGDEATGGPTATDAATDAAGSDPAGADAALTLEDGVVRSAESGMTGAFGTLVNDGGEDVTVVAASSEAAGFMELHEVVDSGGESVMREKAGGFVVGAGESYVLEPGGDHFMLMDLTDPVEVGETVEWSVELDDGSSVVLSAPVRDMAAGDEDYVPGHGEPTDGGETGGMGDEGMGDHDMADHDMGEQTDGSGDG